MKLDPQHPISVPELDSRRPGPTSQRLLRTAAALFREKGYSTTTTRELAALLGIQKASLYHHIDKKEDLLYRVSVDCLNRIQHEVERAVRSNDVPIERLRALIHAHVSCALADQDAHATVLFELRALSGERKAEVIALRDRYEAFVRGAILAEQQSGLLRTDIPAKYLSLSLLNLLNWSIFWFHPDGGLTGTQVAEMLATVFLEGSTSTAHTALRTWPHDEAATDGATEAVS
jgi:TetR/AcrR family transcriptional regulator, cholesterol catabolism regulator